MGVIMFQGAIQFFIIKLSCPCLYIPKYASAPLATFAGKQKLCFFPTNAPMSQHIPDFTDEPPCPERHDIPVGERTPQDHRIYEMPKLHQAVVSLHRIPVMRKTMAVIVSLMFFHMKMIFYPPSFSRNLIA